ncbi:type II toxin-antitoxin system PemK/MazF family toxin [Arthrobacter sp. SX1312]|uniref:type II toxin-antitoxin system PemK/MazF family toxin n=1 Tax=Arthrobacter sp. SX1312 TaxID=2058896 RepID=UPI000CE32F24|nr:type II toxin-antitoxin system PemK/MazF family toxin [Arthrobacter sp. SX1312]
MAITLRSLLVLANRVVRAAASTTPVEREDAPVRRRPARRPGMSPSRPPRSDRRTALGAYSPTADGKPDPGEIVWTWVPYEDDPSQGKDRPVLLVGREGGILLGLMLTSRDRNNAGDHDDRYVDIGTGAWDRQGRPSEVRVDRVLRILPGDVRREGAVLPRRQYEQVVARVPEHLLD